MVIGRPIRHADEQEAAEAIAGFTVANDVSMRDWQNRTLQWLQGKTFEHATPVGPWLVTPDELGGTAPDLELGARSTARSANAAAPAQLVFGPAAIVSYVSTVVTLRPGDLLLTGTPGGVGFAMDPPVFLAPGPGGAHGDRGHRRAGQPLRGRSAVTVDAHRACRVSPSSARAAGTTTLRWERNRRKAGPWSPAHRRGRYVS